MMDYLKRYDANDFKDYWGFLPVPRAQLCYDGGVPYVSYMVMEPKSDKEREREQRKHSPVEDKVPQAARLLLQKWPNQEIVGFDTMSLEGRKKGG